jgi:hypothetical protein
VVRVSLLARDGEGAAAQFGEQAIDVAAHTAAIRRNRGGIEQH